MQTRLIAGRRTPLHRRLGVVGGLLAVAMLIVGTMAAIASARRGFTPPGGPPPLTFLIIPLGDLLVFASARRRGAVLSGDRARRTSG